MPSQSLSVGGFVPDIQLPSVASGNLVGLRESGGRTSVLLAVHDARCPGCAEYVKELARIAEEFVVWDARLLALIPAAVEDAHLPGTATVLIDSQASLSDAGTASLIVADRYGQIFHVARSTDGSHDLPPARAVGEWLKFLGTMCPE